MPGWRTSILRHSGGFGVRRPSAVTGVELDAMRGTPKTGRAGTRALGVHLSRHSVLAGRVLLLFTAVLLAVMPLTEHLWTFDGFICSGQDFEFGVLSVVTLLCLILVVSQHRKQGVAFLLAARRWVSSAFKQPDLVRFSLRKKLVIITNRVLPESSGLNRYTLPLQI
jgi:hypothetical protein